MSAYSGIKSLIDANTRDVTHLFLGDGTSDELGEQAHLMALHYAKIYRKFSVHYFSFNSEAGRYDEPVELSKGTGPHVIRFYNASVFGSNLINWLGVRHKEAVESIEPDVIDLNFGINIAALMDAEQAKKSFLDGIMQLWRTHPGVPIAMHLQQPFRDDDKMASVITAQLSLASEFPQITLVDSYSPFIEAGKRVSLYINDFQTTTAGTAKLYNSRRDVFHCSNSSTLKQPRLGRSWINTRLGENLIRNASLETIDGKVGSGWAVYGDGDYSYDTGNAFGQRLYSFRLSSEKIAYVEQLFDADQLAAARGKKLWFGARVFVEPGGPAHSGILRVSHDGTGAKTASESFRFNPGDGAGYWRDVHVPDFEIPHDASLVAVRIYGSANDEPGTVYVDSVRGGVYTEETPKD
ncbi:hypothetical protein [uncultured Hoeflea sp.]|uniref:hypothetical protein n=1 Tax=uncultured Hoeflea sp. TaxID=538666 RepID=UPI00261D448D|nr:hypothetical protein [uncultured Hoeflea sp.]